MKLRTVEALPLSGGEPRPLASFAGSKVHAVAGIGNPERFFASLRAAGIEVIPHPFPDHHGYTEIDLAFDGAQPLLMTEKDAVKCAELARPNHWYVPAQAVIAAEGAALVQQLLDKLPPASD